VGSNQEDILRNCKKPLRKQTVFIEQKKKQPTNLLFMSVFR